MGKRIISVIIVFMLSVVLFACDNQPESEAPPPDVNMAPAPASAVEAPVGDVWISNSIEEVIWRSTDIIRAEVIDSREEMINTGFRTSNHTVTRLRVLEVYKGDTEIGDIVEVMQRLAPSDSRNLPCGNYGYNFSLNRDDDFVFFLHNDNSPQFEHLPMVIASDFQGVYTFPSDEINTGIVEAFQQDSSVETLVLDGLSPHNDLTLTIGDLLGIMSIYSSSTSMHNVEVILQESDFVLFVESLAHARSEITDKDLMIYFRGRHSYLPNWEYAIVYGYGTAVLERKENGLWVEIENYSVEFLDFMWGSQGILNFDNPLTVGDYRLHHTMLVEGMENKVELEVEFTVIPFENASKAAWDIINMSRWFDELHRPPVSENISITIENSILNMANPELNMTITANGEYTYGEFVLVYVIDGDWNIVPEIWGYTHNEDEHTISPNTENTHTINLFDRFGVLPSGVYRLVFEMHLLQTAPDGTNWEVGSAEFIVEETLDWLLR